MALPTDGLSPPSETERLIGLRNSSGDPSARPMSGQPLALPSAPTQPPAIPSMPATDSNRTSRDEDMPATASVTEPLPDAAITPKPALQPDNFSADTLQPADAAPTPKAAPVAPVTANSAPAGTGGFILE
jgi:hypothetical protein